MTPYKKPKEICKEFNALLQLLEENMNLQDQIQQHKELSIRIEELEEQKKLLGLMIMQSMTGKLLQLGPYIVKRCSRLSITTPLEIARPLNAIKMEEIVDKDAIKALYNSGIPISGVKQVNYIQVSLKQI